MSEELLTVEAAAETLRLHAKTVLRHIREGRLRATKVGKQYRIHRSDLAAFAGSPVKADVVATRATAIVDIEDVDAVLLQRLSAVLLGARQGADMSARLSIDIAHDPVRRSVKVIAIGSAGDVAMILKLADACLEG
jgi:excisionase family DNA binding protein